MLMCAMQGGDQQVQGAQVAHQRRHEQHAVSCLLSCIEPSGLTSACSRRIAGRKGPMTDGKRTAKQTISMSSIPDPDATLVDLIATGQEPHA